MKTWKVEMFFVAVVLAAVVLATGGAFTERLGALAVLLAFGHAQVADRMAEKQAAMAKPDVHCWRWSLRYFVGKELLWLAYFIAHRSWSALVGVGVFLLYPLWRKWWRARKPLGRVADRFGGSDLVSINGRLFKLRPVPAIHIGRPWYSKVCVELSLGGDGSFLKERFESGETVGFTLRDTGRELMWAGTAKLRTLIFFQDPDGRSFASFEAIGEGRLEHV